MNRFIPRFITLVCALLYHTTFAQNLATTESLWQRGVSYEVGWQEMYSTHDNFFHGFDTGVGFRFSPRFRIGVGVEFSYTHYHKDNGWKLYNLKFLPIYLYEQIDLRKKGNFRPFIRFRQGITPTTYLREDAAHLDNPYRITEAGLYLSGSLGFTQIITKHVGIIGEAGFKGFQMSFYPLEVNPHGANFRLGLIFAK